MTYSRTNKKRGYKNNKTKKVGGSASLVIISIFTACMSVLQFIYYITAIQKNVQPSPTNVTISYEEIKKNVESYPEGSPPLISEDSMKELQDENPKGIKAAIKGKYLKKIKRKVHDTTVQGYTLSAKGKKLIIDNIDRISQ